MKDVENLPLDRGVRCDLVTKLKTNIDFSKIIPNISKTAQRFQILRLCLESHGNFRSILMKKLEALSMGVYLLINIGFDETAVTMSKVFIVKIVV